MKEKITNRLIGAEIEYYASGEDKPFHYVDEYYSAMREVNSILLPGSDVLESLKTLKQIMLAMDKKIKHPLGTRGWRNSYGFAFNGVHLHLSGRINKEVLTSNIFKLIDKYGMSPRTVTSWHIFNRPTNYGLKNKNKHQPVYKTPRGTLEIRILDLEYFLNDNIINDLALAIEGGFNGKAIEGSKAWVSKLMDINIDNYKDCCEFLDNNLAPWWTKESEGNYTNTKGNYSLDFKDLPDWPRDIIELDEEDNLVEEIRVSRPTRDRPTLESMYNHASIFTSVTNPTIGTPDE